MEYVTEPARELPIAGEYDVFVAGGGIAGAAAALAAARSGAKVLLCERECMLGGLGTLGIVTIYLPLCDGCGRQVSYGISEELLRLSIKHGAEARYPAPWLDGGTHEEKAATRFEVQYNAHLFAIELERLLLREGVTLLYATSVSGVSKQDGRIDAVIVENKGGRQAVRVKSVVDATGDADVCAFAGEDTAVFAPGNKLAAWYYGLGKAGHELHMLGFADVVDENGNYIGEDQTEARYSGLDGFTTSRMLTLAHEQILKDVLKRRKDDASYIPVNAPTIPQFRMTRRLVGAYELDDRQMHTHFDDSVGMIGDWRKRGPVYELPFRTLYGNKVKNLLCAGRCISVTDTMWDITRVIPVCAQTGEAAGTAAAMGTDFAALDVSALHTRLMKNGVRLHETEL